MKIALAQQNYTVGDLTGNAQKIITAIESAKKQGAELIVFSELSICGYYPHDMLEDGAFIDRCIAQVEIIATHCKGIAAVLGAPSINPSASGKKLYNSAYFLANGVVNSVRHKTSLPTYDIFEEYRHFEPNRQFNTIEYKGEIIALTICEDLWEEVPIANQFSKESIYLRRPLGILSQLNPSLVVNIAASPFSYNQANERHKVLLKATQKYKLPIVYVNQVGANSEVVFDGGSCFVNSQGEICQTLSYFQEDIQIIDTLSAEGSTSIQKIDKIASIHQALIIGIRDYFQKMNFKSVVLGLSGGIDSAVVCALAVEALGHENVHGILMPSKYSSDHSIVDAEKLAQNLNIKHNTIAIKDLVSEFDKGLEKMFENTTEGVAEENIQARIRGTLLMAISNKFGHILLNTTNKSECAVGYGTLYGDMNGGLSILGDLYKTDVYHLARYINREKEIIPENSINKAPSAELRPNQVDTDSLPDYDTLDAILFAYIENQLSTDEIIKLGYDKSVVERIVRLVNSNEYKRYQAPPILRISSKAFGLGRRMPLVAKF
ncbi:MAG: NAD+ synthase [Mangrovibacterium sp.]